MKDILTDDFQSYSPMNFCLTNKPISAEAVIDSLADQTLVLLKMLQSERSNAKSRDVNSLREIMDTKFIINFVSALSKLETNLYTYAPIVGGTYQSILEDVIALDDCPIDVVVHENEILIQMPLLPPKGVYKNTIVTDMLSAKLGTIQLPKWKKWNADFCFVFSKSMRRLAKDADNFETKKVVDRLASALGTSDSAGCFSMSLDTAITDSARPGTYIRITPRANTKSTVFKYWKLD